jgi:hypothetical protein
MRIISGGYLGHCSLDERAQEGITTQRINMRQTILFLSVFLLLTNCGPSGYANITSDISIALHADRDHVNVGQPIHFTLTASRASPGSQYHQPIEAPEGKSVLDIVVGSEELARWSREQPTQNIPRRLDLKPGESKTIEMIWIPDGRRNDTTVVVNGELNWTLDPHTLPAQVGITIGRSPPMW